MHSVLRIRSYFAFLRCGNDNNRSYWKMQSVDTLCRVFCRLNRSASGLRWDCDSASISCRWGVTFLSVAGILCNCIDKLTYLDSGSGIFRRENVFERKVFNSVVGVGVFLSWNCPWRADFIAEPLVLSLIKIFGRNHG